MFRRTDVGLRLVLIAMLAVAAASAQSAPRNNLARYQECIADSDLGGHVSPAFVTDGIVNHARRWQSDAVGPHWCEIRLAEAVEVGSAHVFTGLDDAGATSSFSLQHLVGGIWTDIAGTLRTSNTDNQLRLQFTTPVTTSTVRFYSTDPVVNVREIALYPPAAIDQPWASDYSISLARSSRRIVASSSLDNDHTAKKAIDGYADDSSMWVSANTSGPHTIDIDLLGGPYKIGSVHLHSGDNAGSGVVQNATVQQWNGTTWQNVLAFPLTGNTAPAVEIPFLIPAVTERIRLLLPDSGTQRIREICVYPFVAGGNSFPLGTDAWSGPKPADEWTDHHDDFYNLQNRASGLSLRGDGPVLETWTAGHDHEAQFQLLLQIGSDTFAIRNRTTGRYLEVQNGNPTILAPVIESPPGAFGAMPHQLWRFVPASSGYFRIENVHTGMYLDTNGSTSGSTLRQVIFLSSPTQQWSLNFAAHYPKKGIAGWEGQSAQVGAAWAYNWGEGTGSNLPFATSFEPMFWGDWGWGSRPSRYPSWNRASKKPHLMAFNEPDNSSQANMTVSRSLDLWPLLEESRLPLVSPGMTHPSGSWSTSFMNGARALGHRIDYFSAHWYSSPNADSLMSSLASWSNAHGMPIWLTEWSNVDWGGTNGWTYADCYNFFAEVLHRMELADFVRRYSVFIFRGPANGTTSHFYYANTLTLTPIGELYSAFNGDTVVREDVAYHVHCQGPCLRLADHGGSAPTTDDIYTSGANTQWAIRPGPGNTQYLDSLGSDVRLASNGTSITLVSPTTTDASVQWRRVSAGNGWYYLEHSSGGRLRHNPSGQLEMLTGWTFPSARWRFILPSSPAKAAIGIGCGAAELKLVGAPRGGQTVQLRVEGGISNAPALVGFAADRGLAPLDSIGMTDCWLNIGVGPNLLGTVGGSIGTSGRFDASLLIPKGFLGSIYAQAFVFQPLLNPAWLASTKALAIHVR